MDVEHTRRRTSPVLVAALVAGLVAVTAVYAISALTPFEDAAVPVAMVLAVVCGVLVGRHGRAGGGRRPR